MSGWGAARDSGWLDDLPVAVSLVDAEFRITAWNGECERLFGYSAAESVGQEITSLLRAQTTTERLAALRGRIRAGETIRAMAIACSKDGRPHHVEFTNRPRLVDGRFTGGVVTYWDVTDRSVGRVAEITEHEFRQVLSDLPMPAAVTDDDGRIVFVNRHLAELAGESNVAVVEGRLWWDAYGDYPEDHAFLAAARQGTPTAQYEGRVRTPEGERRVVWYTTSITGLDGRRLDAAVGVDVTAQREAEGRLTEATGQRQRLLGEILAAERSERGRIAEALHDDTVQVLTAAAYQLDRALRAPTGDEPALRAAVIRARDAVEQAADRTRRLMFDLRPELLGIGGLSAAIPALCAHEAEQAGFVAAIETPPGRYSFATEELCYRTVREAVLNTATHADAAHLSVSVRDSGGILVGEVSDDGNGFDPSTVTPIRDQRLHLGMTAMAERVRLAGRSIQIHGEPGHGTRVRFSIPITPEPAAAKNGG